MHWWGLDPFRVELTGRGSRSTRVVLELAWNPGAGVDASLAAELLAGTEKAAQLWAPIGSVIFVAFGAGGHPGVGPAVDVVREVWPAAAVTTLDETVAALVGAGLDQEPAACVVVHLDAEHTSVAVVAGREVVAGGFTAGGARGLAEAVAGYVRTEYWLEVGLEEAWIAAVDGGAFAPSASPPVPNPPTLFGTAIAEDGTLDITRPTGRVTVSPTELRSLLSRAYQPVADLVAQVLRDAPPDTARLAAAPPRPPAARAAR